MKVEVLVAAMSDNPEKLVKKMNISSNAIIANQSSFFSEQKFEYNNYSIKIYNTEEKGVGRNRNVALDRASAEICILADDDQIFYDDYSMILQNIYKKNPEIDMVIFNVDSVDDFRRSILKPYRVNKFNFMRFGAARISFRRKSVSKHGIHFNLHFGGGTEHSAGEDVLFLNECLNKGLKVLAVDVSLAKLNPDSTSTWFTGYNEKFFVDRGVLYATISPKFCYFLCIMSAFKHHTLYKEFLTFRQAFKSMLTGIKKYRNTEGYK